MFIELIGISKYFDQLAQPGQARVAAVKNLSLSIAAGRMLALVGPSGSGKTTLLRCIAGLESPDAGTISIDGKEVFSCDRSINVPTERRNLGMIFQSYALWPNMTVERNVAYPLQRRRFSDADCKARVGKYLELVGCNHLAARYPHELSGGQQQRVSLARALVYEPSVMLFDEPLSNLDATLREQLRTSIRRIQRTLGITGVYVTHDQSEAFYLGDEVAILSQGELMQAGTPDDIYRRPNRPDVAQFTGAVNQSLGRLQNNGTEFQSDDLGTIALGLNHAATAPAGQQTMLLIRPDSVRLRPISGRTPQATVTDMAITGAYIEYIVELCSGQSWRVHGNTDEPYPIKIGQTVEIELRPNGIFLFPQQSAASEAS